MRAIRLAVLVLALVACTSAEEKARAREQAMIAQAQADSAAEAEFAEDSQKLASSITVDTVKSLTIRDQRSPDDYESIESVHLAIAPNGHTCRLTFERYKTIAVGDTLSCQWSPP
jgi:hypothetical protein